MLFQIHVKVRNDFGFGGRNYFWDHAHGLQLLGQLPLDQFPQLHRPFAAGEFIRVVLLNVRDGVEKGFRRRQIRQDGWVLKDGKEYKAQNKSRTSREQLLNKFMINISQQTNRKTLTPKL